MSHLDNDEIFEKKDFTKEPLPKGEYNNCKFKNCNFNQCILSGYHFIDCKFDNCDMSMVVLEKTSLQNVKFIETKLIGTSFEKCNPFLLGLDFDLCQLDLTSFASLKLPRITYKNCSLVEANFTQTYMREALFDHCNLSHAVFFKTDLTKADFRTAENYNINPAENILKYARFSYPNCKGLLYTFDIEID